MPDEDIFVVAKVFKFKYCAFPLSYKFYIEKDFPYSIIWNRIRFFFYTYQGISSYDTLHFTNVQKFQITKNEFLWSESIKKS